MTKKIISKNTLVAFPKEGEPNIKIEIDKEIGTKLTTHLDKNLDMSTLTKEDPNLSEYAKSPLTNNPSASSSTIIINNNINFNTYINYDNHASTKYDNYMAKHIPEILHNLQKSGISKNNQPSEPGIKIQKFKKEIYNVPTLNKAYNAYDPYSFDYTKNNNITLHQTKNEGKISNIKPKQTQLEKKTDQISPLDNRPTSNYALNLDKNYPKNYDKKAGAINYNYARDPYKSTLKPQNKMNFDYNNNNTNTHNTFSVNQEKNFLNTNSNPNKIFGSHAPQTYEPYNILKNNYRK